MQQWKVSKARLHTGYRLSGHSERNSAGPRVENMSRDSPTNTSDARAISAPCRPLSPSVSSLDLFREVTPGPIEFEGSLEPSIEKATGTTRRCANCGAKGHIKTNKKLCPLLNGSTPEPVSIGTEEAARYNPLQSAGFTPEELQSDELALATNAHKHHLEKRHRIRGFSKEACAKVEMKLKARIKVRAKLNERLRARIAEIEECEKYCTKLKEMEEGLKVAREQTGVLEEWMDDTVEEMDGSLKEWAILAGKWLSDD